MPRSRRSIMSTGFGEGRDVASIVTQLSRSASPSAFDPGGLEFDRQGIEIDEPPFRAPAEIADTLRFVAEQEIVSERA